MKTYAILFLMVMALAGCSDGTETNGKNAVPGEAENPSAIDTTQHPNGVSTGSVISTDTAAMRVPAQE